jgi:hypothetical protein
LNNQDLTEDNFTKYKHCNYLQSIKKLLKVPRKKAYVERSKVLLKERAESKSLN